MGATCMRLRDCQWYYLPVWTTGGATDSATVWTKLSSNVVIIYTSENCQAMDSTKKREEDQYQPSHWWQQKCTVLADKIKKILQEFPWRPSQRLPAEFRQSRRWAMQVLPRRQQKLLHLFPDSINEHWTRWFRTTTYCKSMSLKVHDLSGAKEGSILVMLDSLRTQPHHSTPRGKCSVEKGRR